MLYTLDPVVCTNSEGQKKKDIQDFSLLGHDLAISCTLFGQIKNNFRERVLTQALHFLQKEMLTAVRDLNKCSSLA